MGEISQEGTKLLVNKFMTLCEKEDGSLLPKQDIMKNFSKLVFSSHCYGAVVIDKIFSGINKNLKAQGMSQNDVLDIFAQTGHVTYAPHADSILIPTVRVESFTDSVHNEVFRTYRENYGEKLDGIKMYKNSPKTLNNDYNPYVLQENIQIFSSRLINTEENTNLRALKDEHEAHYLIRDEKWQSAPKFKGEPLSEHAVNLDTTSQMMGYALSLYTANAIANANTEELIEKPTITEVKNDLQGILDSVPKQDLKAKMPPPTPVETFGDDGGALPC